MISTFKSHRINEIEEAIYSVGPYNSNEIITTNTGNNLIWNKETVNVIYQSTKNHISCFHSKFTIEELEVLYIKKCHCILCKLLLCLKLSTLANYTIYIKCSGHALGISSIFQHTSHSCSFKQRKKAGTYEVQIVLVFSIPLIVLWRIRIHKYVNSTNGVEFHSK